MDREQGLQALTDPKAEVRQSAAYALRCIVFDRGLDPEITARVVAILENKRQLLELRIEMVQFLSECGDITAINALERIVADRSEPDLLFAHAKTTLMELRERKQRLDEGPPKVRRLLPGYSVAQLIEALSSDDRPLRSRAAIDLGNCRDLSAVDPLIRALQQADNEFKMDIIHGLAYLKDKRSYDAILSVRDDDGAPPELRTAANIITKHFNE